MPSEAAVPVKYFTPLRQAQRNLTRSRIRDAARALFHQQHYDMTTMDEIAVAAGLRRPTLYLHYKDKAEILADIIADYTPKAKRLLKTLPGPKPAYEQVYDWIGTVVEFVAKEKVPLSIILEVRRRDKAQMAAMRTLSNELFAGLGERNPPFWEAAHEPADNLLRARALLLLQELVYSCELYLDAPDKTDAAALLKVTAEDFCRFLA